MSTFHANSHVININTVITIISSSDITLCTIATFILNISVKSNCNRNRNRNRNRLLSRSCALGNVPAIAERHDRVDRIANVSKTIAAITDGYDIRLRPNFAGAPLRVGMDMEIASFDSISEVDMDFTITLTLNQYWTDERLAFSVANANANANDADEAFNLSGDFAERIWVPDTFFANDKHSFLHDVTEKNKMVQLYSNGSIVYGMRFTSTLACMMDLHNYPLDSQNLTVEIESYGYTVDDVVMYWTAVPVIGIDQLQLPQFLIYGYDAFDRRENLSTGVYQRLSLIFKMKRNIGYFVFQTYLPSILIVMLTWVSFWINHEATSARITLGITMTMTMTTISTGFRSSLPRISYVKAIDIYLVMCFVFVFAALLEYAIVNCTYWSSRAKRKSSRKLRKGTLRLRAEGSFLSNGDDDDDNNADDDDDDEDDDEAIELSEVTLSPIPSLRRRHPPEGPATDFPPSLRMVSDVGGHRRLTASRSRHWATVDRMTTTGRNRRYWGQPKGHGRFRVLQKLRRRANSIRTMFPTIRDVNLIDKYSRIVFPVSFILFNLVYWSFYI